MVAFEGHRSPRIEGFRRIPYKSYPNDVSDEEAPNATPVRPRATDRKRMKDILGLWAPFRTEG